MNEKEGYDEWIDERGLLSTPGRLRDDLPEGDYRALYLAWLKAMSLESSYYDEDEDDPENFSSDPELPVPAGLNQLTPPLQALMDFFEIDSFLVSAPTELSPNLSPAQQADFSPLISHLTRPECDEFLLKIVNGEPGAVAVLRKRLLSLEKPKAAPRPNPCTFGELLKTADNLRKAAAKRQAEEKRKKHIVEMEKLAKREAQTWQEVEQTIASGYSAATTTMRPVYW